MMKKLFIILVIILCIPGALLFGSDNYKVTYERIAPDIQEIWFEDLDYQISSLKINGESFSVINFGNSVTTKVQGYAEIPYLNATVMIDRVKNVNMIITPGEFTDIKLKDPLKPSRGVIYRTEDPTTIPYVIDPSSVTDSWYPGNLTGLTDPFIIRDIRGVSVYVYPFQYNAATNTLRIYSSVSVRLYENNTTPENPHNTDITPVIREMDAVYRSIFINYPENSGSRDELTIGAQGDILVITTPRDESAIGPYVDWKREKGYEVSVEVVSQGTLVNPVVQDAYDNNNDLLYVQLVGDWADLKSETLPFGAPMDPQVGCVVGNDYFADISVGRISSNSPTDVSVQVDKIINYEKNTEQGGTWFSAATGIASHEGSGIGDDGESDWQHNDVIWGDKLDPFTFTDYNAIYDPGASSSNVSNAVNTGTSIINYTGHGWAQGWGTTGFSNNSVNNLSNGDKLPLIISVACNNGDFHTGTCFAEAWLRKSNGGAIMMLAASISQPWAPPMRGQDYFMDILIGGYDYSAHGNQSGINTSEQRTTAGTIVFNGLTLMTTESTGYDDWETVKTWNLFGDPSLQVRTSTPETLTLSNNLVMSGIPFSTTIASGSGIVEGAMVCLSRDGTYYSGVTDSTGTVTIPQSLVPGDALMVVTAFNTETIYDSITVIPPDGAYVIFDSLFINDTEGNANGILDYAETAYLSVGLINIGGGDATDVDATILSVEDYLILHDSTELYGDIPAGQAVFIDNAFKIESTQDLPDMYSLMIDLVAESQSTDETWNSIFSVTGHAGVLSYSGYTISDTSGNENGRLDPGESADFIISLINTGSAEAFDVTATLESASQYITGGDNVSFGDLLPGDTAFISFQVSADEGTPDGHSAPFTFEANAEYGLMTEGEFFTVIGLVPVLVIDMDGNGVTPNPFVECLDNLGVGSIYENSLPGDLNSYSCVFLSLGTHPDNYTLSYNEGYLLAYYLSLGGNLYMEGGDTWFYDQQFNPTPVHPMFNIEGIEDGIGDLSTVIGLDGSIVEGIYLAYEGDNAYIDRIDAEGDAKRLFLNGQPYYYCAVSYESDDYKTIGSSFEFGGLNNESYTRDDYMIRILDFFGIEGIWTSTDTRKANTGSPELTTAPNPFTDIVNIEFVLDKAMYASLDVYSLNGIKLDNLLEGKFSEGSHSLTWQGTDSAGKSLSAGIYLLRLTTDTTSVLKKMVIVK